MATTSLSALYLLPPSKFSSSHSHSFPQTPLHIPSFPNHTPLKSKSLRTISFALAESSDSSKSIDRDLQILLQELAECFVLPADYFKQLPNDLRLDLCCGDELEKLTFPFKMLKLNDAAFDLSNGTVKDECGEEAGETLLNISRAWENAETSVSAALVSKLPQLVGSLTSNNKSGKFALALGKRLVSASRRFQAMGQYGQGELQMIAKVMNRVGKALSEIPVSEVADEEPKQETRVLKFGELQVELTPEKAYTGAVIAFFFGYTLLELILTWQVSQGIQRIPESSLEYANDNALLLAKSLRLTLLSIFYSSTFLSAFASVGLVLLAGQLKSKDK
ncbi:hypothetical protein SASPL_127440 [Salvia splendens]|uniref:Uncharacterized protein n=1 Tax=Salvia splendens TaxID=180675 RepID=A0A8X8X980_SALSN|nr:hypothetical protein SASPL_127440 [Salvia splendens]